MFAPAIGKNLRVYESLIEHGIDACNVLANDGFQPTLGLKAVERMARIAGKRVAVNFQIIMYKMLQCGTRKGGRESAAILHGIAPQDARLQPEAPVKRWHPAWAAPD